MKTWIIIFGFAITTIMGNPVLQETDKHLNEINKNETETYMTSLAKCSPERGVTNLINCAASRTLKVLQLAIKTKSIEIYPGVSLISEYPEIQREGKSLAETPLPDNPNQRMEKLVDLILDAASRFFSGRTLKIKIPEVATMNIARALEEGRKKKKSMSPLFLILAAKAILIKKFLIIALGLMSTKALVLSVVALIVALFAGGSSLFSGGGFNLKNIGTPYIGGQGWIGGWSSGGGGGSGGGYGPSYGNGGSYNPGWTTNNLGGWGNSQYPYARSIDVKQNFDDSKAKAQELAYSKQKP